MATKKHLPPCNNEIRIPSFFYLSSPCLESFFLISYQLWPSCLLEPVSSCTNMCLAMSERFKTKAELEGAAEVGPEYLSCSPSALSWFTSILISLRPQTSPETFENLAGSLDSQHLLQDENALSSAWFDWDVTRKSVCTSAGEYLLSALRSSGVMSSYTAGPNVSLQHFEEHCALVAV